MGTIVSQSNFNLSHNKLNLYEIFVKLMDKRCGYIAGISIMHIFIVFEIPIHILQILTKKIKRY